MIPNSPFNSPAKRQRSKNAIKYAEEDKKAIFGKMDARVESDTGYKSRFEYSVSYLPLRAN